MLNSVSVGSLEENKEGSRRSKFLTKDDLLGFGPDGNRKQVRWTDLSQYDPDRNEDEEV